MKMGMNLLSVVCTPQVHKENKAVFMNIRALWIYEIQADSEFQFQFISIESPDGFL